MATMLSEGKIRKEEKKLNKPPSDPRKRKRHERLKGKDAGGLALKAGWGGGGREWEGEVCARCRAKPLFSHLMKKGPHKEKMTWGDQ